jgi:phosphoglycolate phosphatase-like HAD superfamily hydrolase
MDLDLTGSYMVGDQPRDMTAGKSVGCITVFVTSGALTDQPADADHVRNDLAAAARLIAQLELSSPAVH